MPAFDHHLLPLSPPVAQADLAAVVVLGDATIPTASGHELKVRLLGRPHTIDAIAVSIPEGAPEDRRAGWLKRAFEHMVTTLHLTYDSGVDVLRQGDGFFFVMYQSDDPQPRYEFIFSEVINQQHVVDASNIFSVFCQTSDEDLALILALLAEGQNPGIPPHYRVLSLVRAFEMLFPRKTDQMSLLDRYQESFSAIGVSKQQFRNALPEIRTRCAHGVSRGGAAAIVGLGINDDDKLIELARLLRSVLADAIRDRFGIDIRVG